MTQDITTEDLQQQIRCVSHEIRNHLSICDMYSQIIKKNLEKYGIENESIENALSCIQKSIQIIGTNLLDLKSMNNNTPKVIDFQSVVERSAELSKAYIIDNNIEYELFIKNSDKILVDENKFMACLVNIIKNGIEAIETRGKIQIFAEVKSGVGVIKISNDGKPISKDRQNDIFTQGYTTKKNGCGLGLAICKNFLQSQNADIKLTRSTKQQTTFEIYIPVCTNV